MQQTEKQVEWAIGGEGDGEESRSKKEGERLRKKKASWRIQRRLSEILGSHRK